MIAGCRAGGREGRGASAGDGTGRAAAAGLGVLFRSCWRVIFSTSRPTARPANAARGLVAAVSRSVRVTGWPGPGWMWPTFPATLTIRPVSAVADGQEHVDLGGPGHGLPAAEPVVDGPVVQPGITVGERVSASQDRDRADRV